MTRIYPDLCKSCNGTGKLNDKECPVCKGTGTIQVMEFGPDPVIINPYPQPYQPYQPYQPNPWGWPYITCETQRSS